MASYSNATALKALVRASLQSILKSPSAIVFGIAFPLIFIVVFGFLGGGGGYTIPLTNATGSDTANPLYLALKKVPSLRFKTFSDTAELRRAEEKGNIAAQLFIRYDPAAQPQYTINIQAVPSELPKAEQLKGIISGILQQQDTLMAARAKTLAGIELRQTSVREYKTIDFILPGQLGFSLLAGSIFGTAFVFFNLRQTLVLKRFFATPVRRQTIVLGEAIARMLFQLITAIIIISIGHYAFGFTLVDGFATFAKMIFLSMLAVMVFMAFGFIISGLAKNDSSIPPLANLITLPQFLLAGTFFSIDAFPKWLQPISRALPLTYLNDAMRQVAFNGASLWTVRYDILILAAWGVGLYFIAGKTFRWE